MEQNKEEKNDITQDLSMIFENFIKTGVVEKEKEIVPGFKIKVKVLIQESYLLQNL